MQIPPSLPRKGVRALTLPSASRADIEPNATVNIEGKEYPDYVSMAVKYAELVASEKIPSCSYMILATRRFLDMYEKAKKPGGEYYWSDEHAIEPCAFIETLCHVKGILAKRPFILEPWQIWIVVAIYGFRWSDTGYRVVSIAQLEITRKSGKSLLAAGIALYELGPNANIGDDLYIIAPTTGLAKKVLDPMRKMVEFNTPLRDFYGITPLMERMDVKETESYATILSSQGKKQDGHDPKVVIADEFHSLPAPIFNVMKSAQGARPESLFLEIGSAGYNAFGVGWDERNLAIEVLHGKRNRPDMFVAIYTIDPEDYGDWRRERTIMKANPNYGISLDKRKMKQEIEGIFTNPRNKNEVLRTRFNIWGLGEHKLISKVAWDDCELPGLKMETFLGEPAWIGVDSGSRNDMVSKVIVFELDDCIIVFASHFVPQEGPWLEDEEIRDLYEGWIESGHLIATPGSRHSYDQLLEQIIDDCDRFDVKKVVVDDREANWIMGELVRKDIPVLAFRKNAANFSDATKDIQARAVGKYKGIAHDGNPVLAWNVDNTIGATNTADLILPKKPTQNSVMKIDGFDAMVQANACKMNVDLEDTDGEQPMAKRGMRIFN